LFKYTGLVLEKISHTMSTMGERVNTEGGRRDMKGEEKAREERHTLVYVRSMRKAKRRLSH
jgi:hypothetical protein